MSTPDDITTYTVHARRWAGGWELHIDGVGVTQSRTLNDAEAMARDYIALDTGTDPGSFAVEVVPQIDGSLDEETRAARRAVTDADKAQRAAAAMSRDVARKLKSAGLTGREIAVILKISPQRASQLLSAHRSSPRPAPVLRSRTYDIGARLGRKRGLGTMASGRRRTPMTRRRSTLRQAERDLYKADRTLGDILTFQRGGVAGLAKRLLRRKVRRAVGRKTRGWL